MLDIEEFENDYSEIERSPISGGTILPFVIEIDTENSNLYPAANENQRFCYSVTGIGTENYKFADLSYLVLGICDQILQDEIVNISVTINGIEQDVGLDAEGSVQLTTRQNSDRISEYPGLEFDIKLNRTHGEMGFSFELTRPYPIGRNKVYLVGSDAVMNEVSTYGPVNRELQEDYSKASQDASVYIPVEVTPRADSGVIKTSCCGEPTAALNEDRGSGKCCLTIIQPIRVEIPLDLGADVLIGNLHVKCGEETDNESKTVCDCDKTSEGSRSDSEQETLKPSFPMNVNGYKTFN